MEGKGGGKRGREDLGFERWTRASWAGEVKAVYNAVEVRSGFARDASKRGIA